MFFTLRFHAIAACSDLGSKATTTVELTIFLLMGLGVALVWPEVSSTLSAPAIYLVLGGGAAYIFGIIFFILGEYRPIYHCVWHMFVVLAAALHWFDIYFFIIRTDLGEKAFHDFGEAAAAAGANIFETVESIREML